MTGATPTGPGRTLLALGETLAGLQQDVEALADCLRREHALLERPDADALHRLSGEKSGLLVRIEALDRRRARLLNELGHADDADGMAACLAEAPPGLDLATRWQAVREALEDCQRQNRINGGAIELSRRHVQQALSLLRGDAADSLYDQRGSNYGRPDGRHLAEA